MRFKIIIPLLGLLFAFGPAKLRHGLRNLFSFNSEVFTVDPACEGLAANIKAYPGLVNQTVTFLKVLQSWPDNVNGAEDSAHDDLSDAWMSNIDLVDFSSLHYGEQFREQFRNLMYRLTKLKTLLSDPSQDLKLMDDDILAIKNFNLTFAGFEEAMKVIETFQRDLRVFGSINVVVQRAVAATMENTDQVINLLAREIEAQMDALTSDITNLDAKALSYSEVQRLYSRMNTHESSRSFLSKKTQMIVKRLGAFSQIFASRELKAMTTALREVELERTKWDTCVQSCQSAQCDTAVEEFISALAAVL